jgi:ADP-ribose pyrophosphatase YjhB (NUDIX family)
MQRVRTAGAIVCDDAGRLLLIRRGRPPARGRWSIPGGHVEAGETDEDAVRREVAEETGLAVQVDRLAGQVDLDGPPGIVYDDRDYVCSVVGGRLCAGDDAADAAWFTFDEMRALPLTEDLLTILTGWSVLGR